MLGKIWEYHQSYNVNGDLDYHNHTLPYICGGSTVKLHETKDDPSKITTVTTNVLRRNSWGAIRTIPLKFHWK